MQTHRTEKKKKKSNKKQKQKTKNGLTHTKTPSSTGLAFVVRVQGFSAGMQGGARGWHGNDGIQMATGADVVACFGGGCGGWCSSRLATVWALQILGVRARREAHGLSGVGSGAHKLGGKKRKNKVTCSNPHKNATCSSCCTCTADMWTGGLQVVACEAYEDATLMATIRAVRERGEMMRKQVRGKSHSPPVNAVTVLGWRSGAVARRV